MLKPDEIERLYQHQLIHGLHSHNLMITTDAARGLAKFQDPKVNLASLAAEQEEQLDH